MDAEVAEVDEDQRMIELDTLAAIYPEMVVDANDAFTVMLEIPVNPKTAVSVTFPAAGAGSSSVGPTEQTPAQANGGDGGGGSRLLDRHELSYLPSVQIRVSLPRGYPEQQPPKITATTEPPWIPGAVLRSLENDSTRLWEELGRDLVVFVFIDHVQLAADDVFGLVDSSGSLAVDRQHQAFILDYDIKAKQTAFANETFDCGICLDPKKGSMCHRMQDCGHVFCVQCLQDFYISAIQGGDLSVVRCPEPNCAKEREAPLPTGRRARRKLVTVSPGELLQIPIAQSMVQRYVDLKYKTQLESDKDTIYCPRTWCGGAARSSKHKKPTGLALPEDGTDGDGEDDDGEDGNGGSSFRRLAICEDCNFAFCTRCFLSWHGDFVYCSPRKRDDEEAENEQATLRYIAQYTTACPTCAAPVQKTQGCNHMICVRCHTDFCYLCSAWLHPQNYHYHFNRTPAGRTTSCYMRLFDQLEGDGEDAGEGVRVAAPPVAGIVGEDGFEFVDYADDSDDGEDGHHRDDARIPLGAARHAGPQNGHDAAPPEQAAARQVNIAREGPLVLRIALENAPPEPQIPHAPAPVLAARNANGMDRLEMVGQRGRGRGRGQDRGRGRGRGRGGDGRAADRGGRGRGGAVGRGRGAAARGNRDVGRRLPPVAEPLNVDMEAWIRQFVQLALEDNEHLMDV